MVTSLLVLTPFITRHSDEYQKLSAKGKAKMSITFTINNIDTHVLRRLHVSTAS